VVAERPFRSPLPRAHAAEQADLGVGEQRVRRAGMAERRELAPEQQRREQQLGHVLRQRRKRRRERGRRPAEEDAHRQVLTALLGGVEVEAAALLDLPVHAGRGVPAGRILVTLHAVDAEVGRAARRARARRGASAGGSV
jgi:hypothetical protein